MTTDPMKELAYVDGKVNALMEVVMAIAKDLMSRDQFRQVALPALERYENDALNSETPEPTLLAIQVVRGWMDAQSLPKESKPQSP